MLLAYVAAGTSGDFIVGLTTWYSYDSPPVIGRYSVCGRYEGTLAAGATVRLQCTAARSARYIIVQRAAVTGELSFADVDVCAKGELFRSHFDSTAEWLFCLLAMTS